MIGLRLCTLALAMVLALALAGCSSDDESQESGPGLDYPYVERVPVAGCDVPAACDVALADCQQGWLSAVSCLRGMEPMSVPIRVIDEATFADELEAMPPEEPRPSPDYEETALSYLGFVELGALDPSSIDARQVENIAAYYSTDTKDITVIDRGGRNDSISQNSTLFHELVHAAQDQEVDLDAYMESFATTSDSDLGARSLVEGEASFYQQLVVGALNGIDVGSLDLAAMLLEMRALRLRQALLDPSPYLMALYVTPYGLGAPYTHSAYAAAGPQGVRDLYADPPLSTRRLLQLDLAGESEPTPPEFLDVPALTEGSFEHHETDSLGAVGLLVYYDYWFSGMDMEQAVKLSGDRFDVLSVAGSTALVWQLSFDDVANAAAMMDLVSSHGLSYYWHVRVDEGQILMVDAESESVRIALVNALGL